MRKKTLLLAMRLKLPISIFQRSQLGGLACQVKHLHRQLTWSTGLFSAHQASIHLRVELPVAQLQSMRHCTDCLLRSGPSCMVLQESFQSLAAQTPARTQNKERC